MIRSRWLPFLGLLAIQGTALADGVPLRIYGTKLSVERSVANEGPAIGPKNPLDAPLVEAESFAETPAPEVPVQSPPAKPAITPADYTEVNPDSGVGFNKTETPYPEIDLGTTPEEKPVVTQKTVPEVKPSVEPEVKKVETQVLPVVVIVPVEKETPKEKKKTSSKAPPYSQDFQFALRYDMTTFNAVDVASKGKAEIESTYDVRGQLAWRKILFPSLALNLGGYYRMVDFEQDQNSRLKETRQGLHGANLSLEHILHRRITLTYGGGYDQSLFLNDASFGDLEFESLMIPKGEVGAKIRLLEVGKMTLRLNLLGAYLMEKKADDYKVKAGYAYQAGVNLRYLYSGNYFTELEFGYGERVQDTTLTEIKEQSFYGRLNFNVPLFEGSK